MINKLIAKILGFLVVLASVFYMGKQSSKTGQLKKEIKKRNEDERKIKRVKDKIHSSGGDRGDIVDELRNNGDEW